LRLSSGIRKELLSCHCEWKSLLRASAGTLLGQFDDKGLKSLLGRLLRWRLMALRRLVWAAMMARYSISRSRMARLNSDSPRNSARISATVGRLFERTTQ
jgi:hypothetical protein